MITQQLWTFSFFGPNDPELFYVSGSVHSGILCLALTVYHPQVLRLSTYCLPGKEKGSERKLFEVTQANFKRALKKSFKNLSQMPIFTIWQKEKKFQVLAEISWYT